MILNPIYNKNRDYKKLFNPVELSESDFDGIAISASAKKAAIQGSRLYKERHDSETLFPKQACTFEEIDPDEELLVHNYTGQCPVETFEINPVKGCNVGCAYCLVNDGIHETPVVYLNYPEFVEKRLAEQRHKEHFYYFSPKTEAFCEATLQTGVAHRILRVFIEHFEKYPDSRARLFIASKAGKEALMYEFKGSRIIDLFKELKGKMQFNTSLSIFPGDAIGYIEPYSCSIESRLAAVDLCRENAIMANSALVQPIVISILTDERLDDFFARLSRHGIVNVKPEFLTACIENMTLMAQILSMYDKAILKTIMEGYFCEENLGHIKQRGRTAPLRDKSLYCINKIKKIAESHGISISICYWVREQLGIDEHMIPVVNKNGFKCLGYQTKLF